MPTVFRQNGFTFIIRTADHLPPHVHVFYGGEEVLLNIGIAGEQPTIYRLENMRRQNIRRALEIAATRNDELLARWREIHG